MAPWLGYPEKTVDTGREYLYSYLVGCLRLSGCLPSKEEGTRCKTSDCVVTTVGIEFLGVCMSDRSPFEILGIPENPVILAPLAGVSDHPFRRACYDNGADLA